MKKKLLAAGVALALLLGCVTVGWAGSQSDPLISRSYLNGAYLAGLRSSVTQWVAKSTQGIYDAAVARAGQISGGGDGWSASSGFVSGTGGYGDTVTLAVGSGLIWVSGSGAVSSGVLVDATVGAELAPGVALTAGHRYLAGEEAVVVSAGQSAWMAEGRWRCGTGGTVIVPLPFTDVPAGQWYYEDVRFVVEQGLFQGVSSTRFNPSGTMERSMMTTVLHRLAGSPAVGYSQAFSDVPDGQWYTQGTIWCAGQGIVNGVGGGRFAPGDRVTRQQIAVMLYNYAVKLGYAAGERGDLSAFPDQGEVASWAQEAVRWAVGAGLLNGSGGKLLPENSAERAQVAAMLHRFSDWLDRQ